LTLHDDGVKEVTNYEYDHQYERTNEGCFNDGSYKINESKRAFMRGTTASLCTGTILGGEQQFVLAGRKQSIFGLNRECISRDGFPNSTLVAKYLRETAPSTEIKEQRINLYEDTILADDFYDNATSLIVVLLMKLQKLRMYKRMAKHAHVIHIDVTTARAIQRTQGEDNQVKLLVNAIRTGDSACGTTIHDRGVYDILDALLRWIATQPEIPNPRAPNFSYQVNVWHCYSYDDGHSRSGDSFGDVFGFVKNKFLVPTDLDLVTCDAERLCVDVKSEIPATDNAIKNLRNYKYWLNGTNLTQLELKLLEFCLHGNKRQTPFLIDQDLDFCISPGTVAVVGQPIRDARPATYEDTDILHLIHKLVTVHRWHEDALNASYLLRPWYAQPGTDSVEAHWWVNITRVLRLPTLGLKRASIPCLLLGSAVCTSIEAIKHYNKMISANDLCVVESVIYNTAWYWGEFMMIHNARNTHEMIRNFRMNLRDDLSDVIRANALVSSILGEDIDVCSHEGFYTYIEGSLKQHFNKFISFGHIDISHYHEYGYERHDRMLKLSHLVTPGCVALITGRAGTLLQGTPYHSQFTINPMVKRRKYGNLQRALNFYDLWSYGVIARWNGHDIHYAHPLSMGEHRCYAANNVNVAAPPVSPRTLDEASSYLLLSVREREHSWGENFYMRLEYAQAFHWTSERVEVLEKPEWYAPIASYDDLTLPTPQAYDEASDIVKDTLAKLSVKFDLVSPGFHVERMTAGVSLVRNIQASTSDHLEVIQPQEELPPPPPDE